MVNYVKQISQFIEKRKSAKRTSTAQHHDTQLVNKLNCSLIGSQGYSGYYRNKGYEK